METAERFPRRAEQARATKRSIVRAATDLFVSQGYAVTSIASIAAAAGLGVQTVYAAFGNKRAILAAAVDQAIAGDDRPIAVNDRTWMQLVLETDEPAERLRSYARAVRLIHDGAAQMFHVFEVAAAGEPDLTAAWQEALRRRRVGVSGVVGPIGERGQLRDGLDPSTAIDVVWALNGHETYLNLVGHRAWPREQYETWLGDCFVALLLPPTGTSRRRTR